MRRTFVLFTVFLLALATVPVARAQEGETTLVVGITQNWDTLNPNAGYQVSEWEFWTLQYAGLTTLDENLDGVGDLAESWESSEDGLTWTYTLREGLLWSDGTPLTAEDIAWNINTSVEQEWWNHIDVTENLTATAPDDRTVVVTSSVPDPRLPSLGILLYPPHIWQEHATDAETATTYENLDGVGAGPYVLDDYQPSQTLTVKANPNWWGWEGREPGVDKIVFRQFGNTDALVAALQTGEIDAAATIPGSAVAQLEGDPNIVIVPGYQSGWEQIAINGGMGDGDFHPAVADVQVRRAMAHAVDTQAIVEDLWYGFAEEIHVINPSADKKWTPEVPAELQFTYDPDRANQILDDAGYLDTDNDGVREMPDGTNPLHFRHIVNTNTDLGPALGELFVPWMAAIGIEVELMPLDSDQTGSVIAEGNYETFNWGWIPGLDPSGMLVVFTSDEIGGWNDANWYSDRVDEIYELQRVELDEATRLELVHEAVTEFTEAAIYIGMTEGAELYAYRSDRFEGWIRQPAGNGAIMFNLSGLSYPNLQPVTAGGESTTTTTDASGTTAPGAETTTTAATSTPDDTDGGMNWALIGGGAAVLVAAVAVLMRRRTPDDERE